MPIARTRNRLRGAKLLVSVTQCLLLASLSAQTLPKANIEKKSDPEATAKPSESLEDKLPVSLVTFSDPKPVPSAMSSPGIFLPVVCAPDGTVVVSQPMPPSFLDRRITAASLTKPEATVTIDSTSVPGFKQVQFMQTFADDDEIAVLASGKRAEDSLSSGSNAEAHWFILNYDRKGTFKKAIQLEIDLDPSRFGILKSGNFVITGFDAIHKLPRVAIVASDGTMLRYIDMGLDTPDQVRKVFPEARAESADELGQDMVNFAAAQQLVSYEGNLLLVSSRADFPVLEIGDGGVLRSTLVKRPKGTELNWFIPGDPHRWIAQMSRLHSDGKRETLIFEVDPDSGELVRRFEGKGELPMIACAAQNTFITFRINKPDSLDKPDTKAQLTMMTGNY